MEKLKKNIYFTYSILFFIILIVGLLPIEIKNRSFLFSGLFADRELGLDGLKQHILFMHHYVKVIKETIFLNKPFLFFDFTNGLGSDFILSNTYYSLFDPMTIVAYLIPIKYIEFSYYLMMIIRLYLSGVFMIMLAKKIGINDFKALIIMSIFYVFNVTVLFSAFRHPMFINGPMLIPLILLGLEKVLRKEKPYLLLFAVSYALLSQFYFFIYSTFGFELYLIIRLFPEIKKWKLKTFFKLNFLYLLGVGIASIVLLPQLLGVIMGSRASSKGFLFYDGLNYASIILSFFVPIIGSRYTPSIGNAFVFFACLVFFFNEKKKSTYSIYFLILSSLLFFASFGYAINVFSYVNNRWTYLITLSATLLIGKHLHEREPISKKAYFNAFKLVLVMIWLGLLGIGTYLLSTINLSIIIFILLMIILIGITLFFIKIIYHHQFKFKIKLNLIYSKRYLSSIIYSSLVVTLIVSTIYTFYLTPNKAFLDYYGDENTYQSKIIDNDFYRVEQKTFVANVDAYSNDSIYYGFSSTAQYNTMTNGYVNRFIESYNVVNKNNTVGYNGMNFRTRLLAINNVKYIIIRESEQVLIPYGFKYYESVLVPQYDNTKKIYQPNGNIERDNHNIVYEQAHIYVNEYHLQFGTMFYSYLSEDDVANLTPIEKEGLLLDTVIISKDINLPKFEKNISVNKYQITAYQLQQLEIDNQTITVLEDGGSLQFIINQIDDSEVYLEVLGLKNIDKYVGFNTRYLTKDNYVEESNYPYGRNMYFNNENHLVNLGYYLNERDLEVTITFDKGVYEFKEINLYLQSTSGIEEKINYLNNNSLENLLLSNQGFSGDITTAEKGLLYFSIPYSKGFTAFVNNQEVEIYRSNSGFMSVFVEAGTSHIEFMYETPGLKYGIYMSLFCLLIVIGIIIKDYYQKKE